MPGWQRQRYASAQRNPNPWDVKRAAHVGYATSPLSATAKAVARGWHRPRGKSHSMPSSQFCTLFNRGLTQTHLDVVRHVLVRILRRAELEDAEVRRGALHLLKHLDAWNEGAAARLRVEVPPLPH